MVGLNENHDKYRKLEPISRLLRAFAIPPPESIIPTPKEIMEELGIRTPEEFMSSVKDNIKADIVRIIR